MLNFFYFLVACVCGTFIIKFLLETLQVYITKQPKKRKSRLDPYFSQEAINKLNEK